MSHVRILFLGTPEFAVPTLRRLVHSRHQMLAVITQPDRPKGRGMKLAPSCVKTLALQSALNILQPEKASDPSLIEEIRELDPDVAVVVAYGQILKRDFLDLPKYGCINLHPSLLPKYRGPTPIQSAIMAGDWKTGVTIMLLDEGMDTGDILLQREVAIADTDTAGTLHDKLAEAGADLTIETLDAVEAGAVVPRPQDESRATVTRKLSRNDEMIDWNQPPEIILNLIRALDPWPGCMTTYRGDIIKVWKVEAQEGTAVFGEPGKIMTSRGDRLIVFAASGAVQILEVQPPGGRRMPVEGYLRGHKLEEGAFLGK